MIPRSAMPQIDETQYPALLDYFSSQGVAYKRETVAADSLRAYQAPDTFNPSTFPSALLAKPCLISDDGYILDGHHRAAAHKANGTPCPVIEVSEPFFHALVLLLNFPGVRYAHGNE